MGETVIPTSEDIEDREQVGNGRSDEGTGEGSIGVDGECVCVSVIEIVSLSRSVDLEPEICRPGGTQ